MMVKGPRELVRNRGQTSWANSDCAMSRANYRSWLGSAAYLRRTDDSAESRVTAQGGLLPIFGFSFVAQFLRVRRVSL
jgi:hypothetical protein